MNIDLKNVNFETLLDTVERMRATQKRYFSTRNGNDLCAARDAERRTDALIAALRNAQERANSPELW